MTLIGFQVRLYKNSRLYKVYNTRYDLDSDDWTYLTKTNYVFKIDRDNYNKF